MKERYRVGDEIRWRKLDGKTWVEYGGKVAAVIRPWEDPSDHPCLNYRLSGEFGKVRTTVSYLIEREGKIYWPRVKNII